jgi:hypothetical protein
MKHIYLLATFALFTISLHAKADCVDLTGNYQWNSTDDTGDFLKITVAQKNCDTMSEVHDQGWGFTVTRNHVFDGQKHMVENDDDMQVYETATIDASGAQILEERHATDEDGNPELGFIKTTFLLNKDNALEMDRILMDANQSVTDQDQTILSRMSGASVK